MTMTTVAVEMPRKKTIDSFWDFVKKDCGPNADCWEWQGDHDDDGYGRVRKNGKKVGVHRLVYTWTIGEIPEGFLVRHTCHNPPCCNPAHLLIGTTADNSRDMVLAGRSLTGDRNPSRTHRERMLRGDNHPRRLRPELTKRGADNPNSKLNEDQVREIRARFESGESQTKLAVEFGVSQPLVGYIVRRESWKHVS